MSFIIYNCSSIIYYLLYDYICNHPSSVILWYELLMFFSYGWLVILIKEVGWCKIEGIFFIENRIFYILTPLSSSKSSRSSPIMLNADFVHQRYRVVTLLNWLPLTDIFITYTRKEDLLSLLYPLDRNLLTDKSPFHSSKSFQRFKHDRKYRSTRTTSASTEMKLFEISTLVSIIIAWQHTTTTHTIATTCTRDRENFSVTLLVFFDRRFDTRTTILCNVNHCFDTVTLPFTLCLTKMHLHLRGLYQSIKSIEWIMPGRLLNTE